MQDFDAATTKCRTKRLPNLPTDRLTARLEWLIANRARLARESDGHRSLTGPAKEILSIGQELRTRGVTIPEDIENLLDMRQSA